MIDVLAGGLEEQFFRALFFSGAVALIIVAAVALLWYRGRRWIGPRSRVRWPRVEGYEVLRTDDPSSRNPEEPRGATGSGASESAGSRLVREAAARAAALREAWDQSYRDARGPASAAGPSGEPESDLRRLMQELLAEQRQTNALLRELLARSDRVRE